MGATLKLAGRTLGVLGGASLTLIWLIVIWFPSEELSISGPSVLVAGFMALLALVAAIGSYHGHVAVMFVVFIASFLPIGGYLLGVNHWLRFVGILDLVLLLAAGLVFASDRMERNQT